MFKFFQNIYIQYFELMFVDGYGDKAIGRCRETKQLAWWNLFWTHFQSITHKYICFDCVILVIIIFLLEVTIGPQPPSFFSKWKVKVNKDRKKFCFSVHMNCVFLKLPCIEYREFWRNPDKWDKIANFEKECHNCFQNNFKIEG